MEIGCLNGLLLFKLPFISSLLTCPSSFKFFLYFGHKPFPRDMFCDIFLPICSALLFTEIALQPADDVNVNEA